ncbi:helix-turn-helix transcriptional regulator [Falsibacillus albus]|uniref:Helix-turn-helix domain-containing protein n=1 Tax=Falsibacillus albus TaxID=2478915 RepID=A0A3L7K3X9_9BACI|nr:helix-turn-helix domain-containing protein [Falsibacillus albus]RLQ97345.1 helix-turn-helix domain-containing protein [Falsibacillus albus]
MTREEIILLVSEKMRLVRVEANYTQDKMAEVIGISKKTLVQIEKGRIDAGWTTVIALCALFSNSQTLQHALGGVPMEIVEVVAREGIDYRKEKTLGGKVWWTEIQQEKGFVLQKNIITKHYRIIDEDYFRLFSSFDDKLAQQRFDELINGTF